uniref:Protein tyrosine phosphatase mitochondrial 1 n=1 Tax=Sinocyclocheilus grahami TaxID=75366 RepID=A0A672QVJ3_SINGR
MNEEYETKYFCNSAEVSASARTISSVLARILFCPTLAYNVVMEKISSRDWYNRVDPTVILGALHFRSMTEELVQSEKVRGVITMNEEYETKYFCNSAEVSASASSVTRSLPTIITYVNVQLRVLLSLYIHCKAGRSRSATIAALHCWSPEEACKMLASVWPHVLIRSAQLEILQEYFKQVWFRVQLEDTQCTNADNNAKSDIL